MARICFITTCMGRLASLRLTLARMVTQADSRCVLVDYSCPQRCGDWAAAAFPQVRVVREADQTTFSICRARNLGARAADTPWLCFCDADILLEPSFAAAVLPLLRPGHSYHPDVLDDTGLWGTFLCAREDFERVGGYDEVYQGWGENDVDFYDALKLSGVRPLTFPSALLRHLAHGEEDRVRYYNTADRRLSFSINRFYRTVKFDLMRLSPGGTALPRDVRERLYRTVAESVRAARHKSEPLDLTIDLTRGLDLAAGWRLDRSLTYRYYSEG
jgi:glycosyltransferase involved in cell wall biosynthesis